MTPGPNAPRRVQRVAGGSEPAGRVTRGTHGGHTS